ncbi:hypothetical protein ABZ566_20225, partial [Streptomyces hygroscopicus]
SAFSRGMTTGIWQRVSPARLALLGALCVLLLGPKPSGAPSRRALPWVVGRRRALPWAVAATGPCRGPFAAAGPCRGASAGSDGSVRASRGV